MRMNKRMSELLARTNIPVPLPSYLGAEEPALPKLAVVDDSVLFKNEYERAKHVKPAEFPDKTGFECFVNHVHIPFNGDRESLLSCLNYAVALQHELARLAGERRFQVIVSVAEDGCVVRFHQIRSGENWLTEDLDRYAEEAILLLLIDGE